jgi:hypothetical protein
VGVTVADPRRCCCVGVGGGGCCNRRHRSQATKVFLQLGDLNRIEKIAGHKIHPTVT